ncbi:MAG: pyruvate formate lyase family protein [Candidatus Helarchaeota archaeon]
MMPASPRIQRLRKRYQMEVPKISIERAYYFTEKWFAPEYAGLPPILRVAYAMKHVYDNMTHYVDPDDRIAGYWTECFLGIPIDIERGVFNNVLRNELNWHSLFWFRLKSLFKSFWFLLKKKQLWTFLRNARLSKGSMNMEIKTMDKRHINPFTIEKKDKRILLKKILPKWKGNTVIEILEKEIPKSGLIAGNMLDFSNALPANNSKQIIMISMSSNIATYQGHVIIDYETAINRGLLALKAEIAQKIHNASSLSEETLNFLRAIEIAIDGVIVFAKRLTAKIEDHHNLEKDPVQKEIYRKMLENCKQVPLHPPQNFYQAVQAAWTIKTAVELAHPVNLHCFGRMDQILYPYFKKDLEEGRISFDEARELLEELLLKTMSQNIRPESNILSNFYHRYLGSTPITIGGLTSDGNDASNELTLLFLEAANNSRAVTNISLRVNRNTPDEVLLKAAEILYEGSSNLSLFNDDVNVEAMKRRGFSEEDARNYAIMGCVEMLCPGKTGGMSANSLLLCRLLDMTMRNGDSQTMMGTLKNIGLRISDPDTFSSFEEFLDAFFTQARHQIQMIVNVSNLRDQIFAEHLPAPYISAFIQGCLESKRDVTQGGAIYDLSGISFINSIANLTDSLYVIKKLIFEERLVTFAELLQAIDHNFKGYNELYKQILKIKAQGILWGNGHEEVDSLARYITTLLFEETYKYKSYRGGVFVPYMISMTTHTIDGRISIATPDGRLAATPYAASCNPYNVEQHGITAVLRSVVAIDFRNVLGCAVNVKFHPTAVGYKKENREKWVALIRSYFELGGQQIQPTVVSAEMLRDAQQNPANYGDLIIKVGGYSAYFTELGIEIQNEVISRTEHH